MLSIFEIKSFPFSSSSSLFRTRTEDGEGEAYGGRGVLVDQEVVCLIGEDAVNQGVDVHAAYRSRVIE